jgi:2-dehydropantoate 2-reductase
VILVIGAGAVGSFLAWTLAAGGEEVQLLRRNGAPGARTERLVVAGPTGAGEARQVAVAGSPETVAGVPELILLAVKMPDVAGAIETAAVWPDASVLAVENGVGADALLLAGRPSGGLIAGALTTSVERVSGDTIRRLSRGGIVLAPVRAEVGGLIDRLTSSFAAGGLRARATLDPAALRWSKLLVNLMGNATGAIVGLDPLAVYRERGLFRLERRQLAEALAVMDGLQLKPIKLFGADTRLLRLAARLPGPLVQPVLIRVVAAGRGGKRPSLHLHLEAGGGAPTEVEWLNGAVVTAATDLGTQAPVNARLAELVEACNQDPERRAWFRGRPDRLIEAVGTA